MIRPSSWRRNENWPSGDLRPTIILLTFLIRGTLTERKRNQIEGVRQAIRRDYRRMTALMADLDSPAADRTLSELLTNTRSEDLKVIVSKAQKRRERLEAR